jgi:hypothetical protein
VFLINNVVDNTIATGTQIGAKNIAVNTHAVAKRKTFNLFIIYYPKRVSKKYTTMKLRIPPQITPPPVRTIA